MSRFFCYSMRHCVSFHWMGSQNILFEFNKTEPHLSKVRSIKGDLQSEMKFWSQRMKQQKKMKESSRTEILRGQEIGQSFGSRDWGMMGRNTKTLKRKEQTLTLNSAWRYLNFTLTHTNTQCVYKTCVYKSTYIYILTTTFLWWWLLSLAVFILITQIDQNDSD